MDDVLLLTNYSLNVQIRLAAMWTLPPNPFSHHSNDELLRCLANLQWEQLNIQLKEAEQGKKRAEEHAAEVEEDLNRLKAELSAGTAADEDLKSQLESMVGELEQARKDLRDAKEAVELAAHEKQVAAEQHEAHLQELRDQLEQVEQHVRDGSFAEQVKLQAVQDELAAERERSAMLEARVLELGELLAKLQEEVNAARVAEADDKTELARGSKQHHGLIPVGQAIAGENLKGQPHEQVRAGLVCMLVVDVLAG